MTLSNDNTTNNLTPNIETNEQLPLVNNELTSESPSTSDIASANIPSSIESQPPIEVQPPTNETPSQIDTNVALDNMSSQIGILDSEIQEVKNDQLASETQPSTGGKKKTRKFKLSNKKKTRHRK